MGIFGSKVDVDAIEEIETCVVKLIVRISDEEVKMDQLVKHQISRALCIYSKQMDKEKKRGYISKEKIRKTKNLINEAQIKLDGNPTYKQENENVFTDLQNPNELKSHLSEIEKNLKANKILEVQSEYCFQFATECVQKLVKSPKSFLKQDEEDALTILLLKLFLNSPQPKISNILNQNIQYLNHVIKCFHIIDPDSINFSNEEEVNIILSEFRAKVEILKQVTAKFTNQIMELTETDSQSASGCGTQSHRGSVSAIIENFDPLKSNSKFLPRRENSTMLKKINDDLNQYKKIVENFCPPMGDDAVANITSKITDLINIHVNKISSTEEKVPLHDKAKKILNKLNNINDENKQVSENFKVLKDVEDQVLAAVESNSKFEDKAKIFQLCREILTAMNTTNSEVLNQNTEIINRIEGLFTVETANHLRQMTKTVDHYRMYAEQFPFPTLITTYAKKREEILSLIKHLSDFPKLNSFIQTKVKINVQKIHEAAEILKRKAEENDSVFLILEFLEHIRKRIHDIYSGTRTPLDKLHQCNHIRSQMEAVDNFSHRIHAKKAEVRNQLHIVENELYAIVCPSSIQEIKTNLDECEEQVPQFIYPLSSEMYQQQRNGIIDLVKNVHRIIAENLVPKDIARIIYNTVNIISDVLYKTAKRNQDMNNSEKDLNAVERRVKSLKRLNLQFLKQQEYLDHHEEIINKMKITCKQPVLLNKLTNIETSISIEKCKMKLIQINEIVKQLKGTVSELVHPINTDEFKENISQILNLKENVEDMPEGDAELDSQKHVFLQEIYSILQHLDEHVGKAASRKRQMENILNLQNHFNDFNTDSLNVSKNSLEFLQVVRRRAESFEDGVKHYLGASYSVDYYVIHENLVRLLEELDYLTCQDNEQLLAATVETMGYVKSLIQQLDVNAETS